VDKFSDIKVETDVAAPLGSIHFVPTNVPCPHCGVRYAVADLAMWFAAIDAGTFSVGDKPAIVTCSHCSKEITRDDFGRYFARIDNVR
jgi:endogenous inhibitor of DNA gyrase (YacG/DUF329 family)